MKWFAVRSVVRHGAEGRGKAIYEERVLLYRTRTPSKAVARAKSDTDAYLAANPQFALVGEPSMFVLNAKEENLDGAEAWSCLHTGPADQKKYWAERYEKYAFE
jgi:hypothetical protein